MAKSKSEWKNLVEGQQILTGENSQLRLALVETTDKSITGVVTIRKWAKYCTAVDKMAGLTKDSVPFRPTQDGISFPASVLPAIIADLQKIYQEAIRQGVAEFVPTPTPAPAPPVEEKTSKALPAKSRKKIV